MQEAFELMRTAKSTGDWIREQLSRTYSLNQLDLGADARLAKKGFTFETESYEIAELGHLCIMRMKAMLGLMRMETVMTISCIRAPTTKREKAFPTGWRERPGTVPGRISPCWPPPRPATLRQSRTKSTLLLNRC